MKLHDQSYPGHKHGLKVHSGPRTPSPLPRTKKKKRSQHQSPEYMYHNCFTLHTLFLATVQVERSSSLQSSLYNILWGWLSCSWVETSITGLAQGNHDHFYNLEAI